MSSLQYERLCVLFNIGVLQGQIAAAQNFQTDEGLKTAAKMFQVSTSHLSLFIPRNILLTMGQKKKIHVNIGSSILLGNKVL